MSSLNLYIYFCSTIQQVKIHFLQYGLYKFEYFVRCVGSGLQKEFTELILLEQSSCRDLK